MPDGLPGLARWVARRLPREIAERAFLPACHDLQAEHVENADRRTGVPPVLRAAVLGARILGTAIECSLLAAAAARRARSAPRLPAREQPGVDPMLIQDLKFAARMLWKNPGFTGVAMLALALGIGANTAIFSVVHAVLLRPLPYAEPDRVLRINETMEGRVTSVSPVNFLDWKAQNRTFAAMAAFDDTTATLGGGAEPERMQAAAVGVDVFSVLGVAPMLGRTFVAGEEKPGGPRVVMLGAGVWQRRFGGDPGLVGRTLRFDGRDVEVVGIMPPEFAFPGEIDLWFPLVLTERDTRPNQRGAHYLQVVGRLKPGVTAGQANDDLSVIERRIAEQFENVQGYGVWARPLLDSMTGDVKRPLYLLLGAVGFVLLIACVNVSNLLLARASTRRTEIAIRSALGAGRGRIIRQLLAESVLLSLAGGTAGVLLATWGVRALAAMLPSDLPRAAGVSIDQSVLLFSVLVSILTGALFGIAPAIYASTPDLAAFLKDARRDGAAQGGRRTLRSALIAAEVALALVLLAGAGVAMRSFDRLRSVEPGFDPRGVLSLDIVLPETPYGDMASVARFYRQYLDGLAAQPGVIAAGAVMMPPLSRGGFGGSFSIIGRDENDDYNVQVRAATPGYFETLRIPLRRGRLFTSADREGAPGVALISDETARRFWPGEDPIGKRIRIHVSVGHRETEREIVGVVGDVKIRALDANPPPVAYVPHAQYVSDQMTVFVRAAGDPLALLPMARSQLAALDREIAPTRVQQATQLIASSVAEPRFRMLLLGLFAALAVALAAVGLYGVMAFSVSQRRNELGLRMALGADSSDVLGLVLRQGLLPVGIGIALGLAGATLLTQLMSGLLYEVSAFDPLTLAGVSVLLALVASAACYIPARRATTVDPLTAIRQV